MFNFLKKKTEPKNKVVDVYAVAPGQFVPIDQVEDPVFSKKMMGDGFAILPDSAAIYSPVTGKVVSVFPTQHALGIESDGLDVLLHMGIDTVELNGEPFDISVQENQSVTSSTQVATVDLAALDNAGKNNAMIVVFTNSDTVVNHIEWIADGQVQANALVAKVHLK